MEKTFSQVRDKYKMGQDGIMMMAVFVYFLVFGMFFAFLPMHYITYEKVLINYFMDIAVITAIISSLSFIIYAHILLKRK